MKLPPKNSKLFSFRCRFLRLLLIYQLLSKHDGFNDKKVFLKKEFYNITSDSNLINKSLFKDPYLLMIISKLV